MVAFSLSLDLRDRKYKIRAPELSRNNSLPEAPPSLTKQSFYNRATAREQEAGRIRDETERAVLGKGTHSSRKCCWGPMMEPGRQILIQAMISACVNL